MNPEEQHYSDLADKDHEEKMKKIKTIKELKEEIKELKDRIENLEDWIKDFCFMNGGNVHYHLK